ncbi:hypothetical protein KM043_011213 [Ampulex compressa]|nr:hypothetical protein KM043_011213 [Ampulex compressa]
MPTASNHTEERKQPSNARVSCLLNSTMTCRDFGPAGKILNLWRSIDSIEGRPRLTMRAPGLTWPNSGRLETSRTGGEEGSEAGNSGGRLLEAPSQE